MSQVISFYCLVYIIFLLFGLWKIFSGHVLLFNSVTFVWTSFAIPGLLNLLIVTPIYKLPRNQKMSIH